jgi:hypothetical protein
MSGFAERYIGLGNQGVADRREATRQNALQMYLPNALSASTAEQRNDAVQGLAKGGAYQEAMGFRNQYRQDDEAAKAREVQEADKRARIYFNVQDDAGLQAANQAAMQMGAKPEQLPKTVQEARNQVQMVMSLKDQYEQQMAERKFGLEERELNSNLALNNARMGTERAQALKYYADARRVQTEADMGPGGAAQLDVGAEDPIAPISPYSGLNARDQARLRLQNEKDFAGVRKENDKEVSGARQALIDAKTFLQAMGRVEKGGGGTGGWFSAPMGLGDVAQGVYRAVSPNRDDYATMSAITARLVPKLREPGSGATSDFDARMFERGTIGLAQPGPTNQVIARGIVGASENLIQKAQFEDMYFQRYRTLNGADRAWGAYLNDNPIFDPNSPNEPRLNVSRQPWQQWLQGMSGRGQQPAQSQPMPQSQARPQPAQTQAAPPPPPGFEVIQ